MEAVEPELALQVPEEKDYKRFLIATIVVLVVAVVPVIPVFPVYTQYDVPKTRIVDFSHSSEVGGSVLSVPMYVNVTNNDSTGGDFSVTMNLFRGTFSNLAYIGRAEAAWFYDLDSTVTQTQYIGPHTTCKYDLPEGWYSRTPLLKFTYSVSTPTKQEKYNVTETKTEYKSILDLIKGSLARAFQESVSGSNSIHLVGYENIWKHLSQS